MSFKLRLAKKRNEDGKRRVHVAGGNGQRQSHLPTVPPAGGVPRPRRNR